MLDSTTFAARRSALASALPDGLVVLLGNHGAPMNYPANLYPFRQDGSFRYYTGLDAPGLALTLDTASGAATLFGREVTMEDRVWDGETDSMATRAQNAGIDQTDSPDALTEAVQAARAAGRTVMVLPPYRGDHRLRLGDLLGIAPSEVTPSEALVDAVIAQRLVKTEAEIDEIERALEIAAEMHLTAMWMAHPGASEHEVAAQMAAVAASHGSHPSFPIILTTRGEVPHHHASAHVLEAGDLLLHDAGCVAPGTGYCSDVTRVSPVGGTFSARQRAIYDVVLDAQTSAIEICAPGTSFRTAHDLASHRIAVGLVEIGLLRGAPEDIVASGAHAAFFHHGLGHALGLDVHDLEALGEDRVGYAGEATRSDQFGTSYLRFARALQPGHVMTVEPGIYFNAALIGQWKAEKRFAEFVDYDEAERWIGFGGVRIEDDIVITDDGCRVLGPEIPKRADEVEAVVQSAAE